MPDGTTKVASISSRRSDPNADDDSPSKGPLRGLPRIQGVGGSLTFLTFLTFVTWGVRHLRSVIAKRQENKQRITGGSEGEPPLVFGVVSVAAFDLLLQSNPTPVQILDLRSREESRSTPVENAINVPGKIL